MRPQEAFKLGFLARCVEEGFSSEQTHALAKRAADCFTKQAAWYNPFTWAKSVTDAGKSSVELAQASTNLLKSFTGPLMMLAAVPPTVGGVAAYLANKSTDVDDAAAVEDVKNQELTDAYQRMADQLNRQKQLREYKQSRKRSGRVYL